MRWQTVGRKDCEMKKFVFAAAAALVCSPLAAQDAERQDVETAAEVSTEEAAPDEAEEAEDKDRVICRRTAVVGSKFKKKLCGTQEMWDQMSARGRDATAEFQRKGRGIRQGN